MSLKRLGLSFVATDPMEAQRDRDVLAAIQDLQGVEVEVTSPTTPDQEFQVLHKLQTQIPRAVVVLRQSKPGVVYASRVIDWDRRRIFVKCTVAEDQLLLWVR